MNNVLRKLRIAFSAICGIICLLLIALWVRSYSRFDSHNGLLSAMGRVYIRGAFVLEPDDLLKEPDVQTYHTRFGTSVVWIRANAKIAFTRSDAVLPYWALTLLAVILTALPWLPWRFSLRTLLIATTLLAVLLGAIVYAVR